MTQQPTRTAGPAARISHCLSGGAVILALMIGCSRDSSESAVVDPPVPQSDAGLSSDQPKPRSELSGGIELPEGEIPPLDANAPSPSGEGIEMPDDVELNPPSTDSSAVENTPNIVYASWSEIQDQAQSTGKVTVVDLWSLTCEPCLKELPGLVALHKRHRSSVQCIAVDMDYDGRKSRPPQHYADRVAAFLASVGAIGFPTYISETPSEDVFTSMQIASLPAVLVYGADGRVVKTFVDVGETAGFNYESDIAPLVANLTSN